MTYKDEITKEMTWLGQQKNVIFIGEGLINAGRIYSTLDKVPVKKCIEMPVAENLIVGCAIGLAIRGYKPVVIFNFMDFMLIPASAIIHHLAGIPKLSNGKVKLPVIIRTVIGRQGKKFKMGCQHDNDFSNMFKGYVTTFNYFPESYKKFYSDDAGIPAIIVERRDDYETNCTS